MNPRLLISHQAIVHDQPDEDRGKASADHIEGSEEKSPQCDRDHQRHCQSSNQTNQWAQRPMGNPEEKGDDNYGEKNRVPEIAFHTDCYLGKKNGPAGHPNTHVQTLGVNRLGYLLTHSLHPKRCGFVVHLWIGRLERNNSEPSLVPAE